MSGILCFSPSAFPSLYPRRVTVENLPSSRSEPNPLRERAGELGSLTSYLVASQVPPVRQVLSARFMLGGMRAGDLLLRSQSAGGGGGI